MLVRELERCVFPWIARWRRLYREWEELSIARAVGVYQPPPVAGAVQMFVGAVLGGVWLVVLAWTFLG